MGSKFDEFYIICPSQRCLGALPAGFSNLLVKIISVVKRFLVQQDVQSIFSYTLNTPACK